MNILAIVKQINTTVAQDTDCQLLQLQSSGEIHPTPFGQSRSFRS